jgi:hypothetical protein
MKRLASDTTERMTDETVEANKTKNVQFQIQWRREWRGSVNTRRIIVGDDKSKTSLHLRHTSTLTTTYITSLLLVTETREREPVITICD